MSNLDVPFVFQFSDIVAGHGFFAHVEATGCGIVRGRTYHIASLQLFRADYQRTIFGFAASAATFDAFKSHVDEFLQYIDDADTSRWGDVLAQTLRMSVPPGLVRVVDGAPPSVRAVTLIDKPTPRFNKLSEIAWATLMSLP